MPNTLTVTTPYFGSGSLASELAQNASDGGGDTIVFDPSLTGKTIYVGNQLYPGLTVNQNVIVDGGSNNITIDGQGNDTVFTITAPGQVEIDNLTIADGSGSANNGSPYGISTGGSAAGGILVQSGSVTLKGDTFVNNTATGGAGAAFVGGNGGDAAGAILVSGGSVSLSNDAFLGGSATGGSGNTGFAGPGGMGGNAAGAIYVEPGATVSGATNLQSSDTAATAGTAGSSIFGNAGTAGTAYPVSNNTTVNANDTVVCFCSGTLIRAWRGGHAVNVPVEALRPGDLAVTASGRLRPVVWTGHRSLHAGEGGTLPHAQQPVRALAGAFGPGLPARPLWLSSGHPVLVGADADGEGGVLVPVMCLVNGTSVARLPVREATYWHVELDRHDILLAEGLAAESYLDMGSRAWFGEEAQHAPHPLLDPDHVMPGMGPDGRCRPVEVDGPAVETERRRLDTVFTLMLAAQAAWPATDGAAAGAGPVHGGAGVR